MLSTTFHDWGGRADDPDFSVDLTRSMATFRTPEILYKIHRNCYTYQGDPDNSFPYLLGAKSMPALIIKPRFILVTHTDDLGWYITNLNMIVRKKNVTPRQFLYCTTDSIPIDLMFQENFPTHTQVWNCLIH